MASLIRKNDTVQVMTGKYGGRVKAEEGEAKRRVGRRGRVLSIDCAKGKAIIEGVNIAKKHQRPDPKKNVQGGRVDRPMPVPLSILRLVCPNCGPVRVKTKRQKEETAEGVRRVTIERVCVKCGHNFG